MYFAKLPQFIQEAIKKLPRDDVFQQRFATDPVLDQIDMMKENHQTAYQDILSVLGMKFILNGMKIPPLTAAVWSFLWVLKNPFVYTGEDPTPIDADVFLYTVFNGVGDGDTVKLVEQAIGFCKKVLNIDFEAACEIILELSKFSFRPLKLLPQSTTATHEKPLFDADWLTSIVSKVHIVTGFSPAFILTELSLNAVCYYFAQYRRSQGDDKVYKRTDEEIILLQIDRCCELICDRLIELGVFPQEDKEKYKKIMVTNPCK